MGCHKLKYHALYKHHRVPLKLSDALSYKRAKGIYLLMNISIMLLQFQEDNRYLLVSCNVNGNRCLHYIDSLTAKY